ncbi:lipocalin-like domain-containing protein [Rhizobium sp. YIM 134829]|uniref:lipocalin-like domain-containing protein n=1 Tax=Rhizobium sp. YIM 134829 TaxID=3390453 RepID=UPI00397DED70
MNDDAAPGFLRRSLLLGGLASLAVPRLALAQGFAGLGTTAEGFSVPAPGKPFVFPRDHGAHPHFRIEWWYLTANLEGPDGTPYGVQWTLFRSALAPREAEGWQSPQIWLGHAAITTRDKQFVAERLSRGGIGQAGVIAAPFAASIDDWRLARRPDAPAGADELSHVALQASGTEFSYDLRLTATGPLVPQGQNGYSVKSAAGQASFYYSQPFYTVEGTLVLPSGTIPVTGQAWLDREWSSQPLASDQTGWDWFSLHFASGEKLMGFRLRDSGEGYTSATWIAANGTPTPLPAGALSVVPLGSSKVAGRAVPTRWQVRLPARGLDIVTEPINTQAWMATRTPYWEGPITISGSHKGRGYLEMTGY